MMKKSAVRKTSTKTRITVRKSAGDLMPPSPSELARLRRAKRSPPDTSEIPESRSFNRLRRNADGSLPRRGMIREAIEAERKRRGLSVYGLWKKASAHHSALSQAAVHEFLKGQRQLELPSAEALLIAVELKCIAVKSSTKKTAS